MALRSFQSKICLRHAQDARKYTLSILRQVFGMRFAGPFVAKAIFRIRVVTARLERYHPVNAICTEDAELAFVIAAKVNQATTTLAGAG